MRALTGTDYDGSLKREEKVSENKKDYMLGKDDLAHSSFAKTDFKLLELTDKDLERIDAFYDSKKSTLESSKILLEIAEFRKERGITGTFGHTDAQISQVHC